jgi:DNA-directed RNA polymerase beta subunit
MVVGQIMENCITELAVRNGCYYDLTAFNNFNIEQYIRELEEKHGMKYGGKRKLWNGRTGCPYEALIFMGPIGYHRLQKFVIDQSYAMNSGPTCSLTNQPISGRAFEGGLRLGEMEKDCITGNGAQRALAEKFHNDSDGNEIYICYNCGAQAIINPHAKNYICKYCDQNADIRRVPSSTSSKLLMDELRSMGIKITYGLEPMTF